MGMYRSLYSVTLRSHLIPKAPLSSRPFASHRVQSVLPIVYKKKNVYVGDGCMLKASLDLCTELEGRLKTY